MSAASPRPKAPTTDVDTPNPPTSTASAAVSIPGRLRLDEAQAHLAEASDALDGWYARQTTAGHSYVGDGHEVIRLIDAATRELYRLRGALIDEIRTDEDERAVRVDRMIAELTARRSGGLPGDGGTPRALVGPAGAWRENDAVEVRYPLPDSDQHNRSSWPWLPGTVLQACGPDQWQICVQVRELATLEDGRPPRRDTPEHKLFYPVCVRDSSEIQAARGRR